MKILGIAAPFGHDGSAALMIDGKVIAAAEEERFTRKKHADGQMPVNAVRYCLAEGNIKLEDIDYIAYPWALSALKQQRFKYFLRTIFTRPSRAFKKFFRNKKELKHQKKFIQETLSETDKLCKKKIPIVWVEHHLAHSASSYYFSGMDESAILSIDTGGEITATMLGSAKGNKITKIKELIAPDSLGAFYATLTDYLGFRRGNGEYKVMGMAPYGNSEKFNFDFLVKWNDRKGDYKCSDDYIWVSRKKRADKDKVYSKKMADKYGKSRVGDGLSEPYIDIAAATQEKLEEIVLKLIDRYLKKDLERHGNLCFAGGVALNVVLNKKILELPYVKNLYVQPAAHDAGTSLGAAVYAAANKGESIEKMTHAYWGPEYSDSEIKCALNASEFLFEKKEDIYEETASLLDDGKVVGWFQGRMEWGPRALGNRSILGNPTIKGTADLINAQIKFRENWRPFCPSILKEHANNILVEKHDAPFMTIAFTAKEAWHKAIPEVIHVNNSCRPQLVDKELNPKFYNLITRFYKKTNVPVLINTSLNRRGEPMVCSPEDALEMFRNCGLKYMAMGDYLIWKKTDKNVSSK